MSRPLFRDRIPYRPMMEERENPSRRRSIWALTTSLMAGAVGILNDPPAAPRPRPSHPSVREIHKNAWLKRQTSVEKKGTPFTKKGEKFWVVFCVHDDSEAFLEFYSEPKMGTIHKPLSALSLNSCLHVSPSIVPGQDNEYQFAVTLQSDVIRLVAANWDQMIEWVESLQGKLREMNILSPKDNLYSKLPETKGGTVASTRDPNSPLPPTPIVWPPNQSRTSNQNSGRSEQTNRRDADSSNVTSARDMGNAHRNDEPPPSNIPPANNATSRLSVNGNSSLSINIHDRDNSRTNVSNELHSDSSRARNNSQSILPSSSSGDNSFQDTSNGANGSQQHIIPKRKQQVSMKVNVDVKLKHRSGQHRQQNGSSTASTTVVVIGNGDVRIHDRHRAESRNGEVAASVIANSAVTTPSPTENGATSTQQISHGLNVHENNPSTTSCVSRVAVNCSKAPQIKPRAQQPSSRNVATSNNGDAMLVSIESTGGRENLALPPKSQTRTGKSSSSENIYEHIYIPERPQIERTNNGVKCNNGNNHQHKQVRSQNGGEVNSSNEVHHSSSQRSSEEESSSGSVRELHARRLTKSSSGGSNQRSSSLGRSELPSGSSRPSQRVDQDTETKRNNGNRNHGRQMPSDMPRSIGNFTFIANNGSSHHPAQLQGNPLDALIGSRSGEYRLRRDEYLIRTGESNGSSDNDNQSNRTSSQSPNELHTNGGHLPLKEQQVLHLQMEINHPGGVRLILRKKDCLSSIAFVDYLGAVWVAGWKQTQYPVLYYGFHVGDQILKVAGVNVQSSVEASRAIKMISSMQVEFIIRRLPYGKVFALKRSRDGEPLGLVAEGGSGEISEVLPEGLAARYGLPPKGVSVDGQKPCNWYLTEVNNRPLSLMSKENEVKDRLNAVGKEISILVQPADLVKHLRKSLKSYKGFKDYVVG